MRTFACVDCPPGVEHTAGDDGPLPLRCPPHRSERERSRGRRRRSPLTVVREQQAAPTDAGPDPEATRPGRLPVPLAAIVAADLDGLLSTHPARDTLTALAGRLAEAAEVERDSRALPALVRELRAVLSDLLDHEEAEDDDIFGEDDLPTAVVESSAG